MELINYGYNAENNKTFGKCNVGKVIKSFLKLNIFLE